MALTPLWRVFGLSSKEAAQRASTETIKLEAQNLSSIQDQQPQPLCIYGCASSGKTTLLFHYAVSLAHHDRDGDIDDSKLSKVVLISPTKERLARHKPRQCSLQPKLPKTVLNRIELRYLPNLSELLQYLCCAHMDPESRPAAILVDALDFYTKNQAKLAQICSLLSNASALPGAYGCTISQTASLQADQHLLHGLAPWFPSVMHTHVVLETTTAKPPKPKRSKELGRRQQQCLRCEACFHTQPVASVSYNTNDSTVCYTLTSDTLTVLYAQA
eukprot:TRINITY_DN5233_c0_g1_i3.p1 TRINITY_DN5233_c0_g1~~TRINITY_DN5233_c0_g1_i3.p1  ORF type:complete len:273 (+),score=46.03 TRINITY_DN5233_c0_g1_i3:84-902(+)